MAETIGDVAFEDAWKVERLSATQLLIKPGEAWFQGLPIVMRSGKDQLVSGAVLSIGSVPVGVTVDDDPTGLGKILTFGTSGSPNNSQTTPTNTYRLVVTAKEELITDVQDEFLKNANLTESTAQKVRLTYQLSIVPEAVQEVSPIPYRDETSTGGSGVTNYPDTGGDTDPNFQNQIIVNPSVGSGDLVSSNVVTGSEVIDGRDLELVINNPVGANPFPVAPTPQTAFANGKLIDSVGTTYHITRMFNDTVSGRIVLRIDKEFEQVDPQIINGSPYTVEKAPVYATDDNNGAFIGKLYYPIATFNWTETNGFQHSSDITDLLNRVDKVDDFQTEVADKFNLRVTDGGNVSWDSSTDSLTWTDAFDILNAAGATQTIAASTAKILEGGALVYELDYAGGAIEKGNVAINITAGGTTITVDPITFEDIKVGNAIEDSAGTLTYVLDLLPSSNQIIVDSALTTGAGTIYRDSYAMALAPRGLTQFVLAVRNNNKVYIAGLELESGETSQIGDGLSAEILTFIGATGETDSSPDYASEVYVTDGDSLVTAISNLDAALDALAQSVGDIPWKATAADFASLPTVGNVDGDVRLVLDTRVAYHWDDAQTAWLPLTGSGGGIKVIGGGTLSVAEVQEVIYNVPNATPDQFFAPNSDYRMGQSFTPVSNSDLVEIAFNLAQSGFSGSGSIKAELYNTNGSGTPTTLISTSTNTVDPTTLPAHPGSTPFTFTFSNESLTGGTQYAIIISMEDVVFGGGSIGVYHNTSDPVAGQGRISSTNGGSSWSTNSQDVIGTITVKGASLALSFTEDMYLEKAGLDYADNTISAGAATIGTSGTPGANYDIDDASGIFGQSFTFANDTDIDEISVQLQKIGNPTGWNLTINVYEDNGGEPDSISLGTSNPIAMSAIQSASTTGQTTFSFPSTINLTGGQKYWFVVNPVIDGGGTFNAFNYVTSNYLTTDFIPTEVSSFSANNGGIWTDDPNDLLFTIQGTGAATQSPITFTSDLQVAYVEPNLIAGGSDLTVTVDSLDNVPPTGVIIARRDGTDIIIGSSSTRLAVNESMKLYDSITDQAKDKYRGADYGFFRSDEPIVWTGTDIQFTQDIILEMFKADGTAQAYTINTSISPYSLGAGDILYFEVDRTVNSGTLTPNVATSLPTLPEAGKDIVVFAKRVDVSGVGYLHLPLHKQVLEPGQTVRLGASGAGGGSANSLIEAIEDRLCDSIFELATPVISELHQEDRLDGTSTATYSPVSGTYEFGSIGDELITIQLLDAAEFLAEDDSLSRVELLTYWDRDDIDTGATYEVSRNGGNEWQTVTMERIGNSTEVYRGIHTFAEEAANQTLSEEATNDTSVELDDSSNTRLGQEFTLANKSVLREVSLDLVVNGSPTGQMYVSIVRDDSGLPSTDFADLLSESSAIDISGLSSGALVVDMPEVTLTASTYHVVVRTDAQYKSGFATGTTSIELSADSAGPASSASFDGSVWSEETESFVHAVNGIELDLRVRITSSIAESKLAGIGALYNQTVGSLVTGDREVEFFSFAGQDNTKSFAVSQFTVNPDLLRVYDINEGKVYRHGAFSVDGNTVVFNENVFFRPGETVRLVMDQSAGGAFDSSDINGLLLASNHLGSTDGSIDRSVAGRGIFLRRPDGTLRELIINDNDEIEIYSV